MDNLILTIVISVVASLISGSILLFIEYKTGWFSRAIERVGIERAPHALPVKDISDPQRERGSNTATYDNLNELPLCITKGLRELSEEIRIDERFLKIDSYEIGSTHSNFIVTALAFSRPSYGDYDSDSQSTHVRAGEQLQVLVVNKASEFSPYNHFVSFDVYLPNYSKESRSRLRFLSVFRATLYSFGGGFVSISAMLWISESIANFYKMESKLVNGDILFIGIFVSILLLVIPPIAFIGGGWLEARDESIIFLCPFVLIIWSSIALLFEFFPIQSQVDHIVGYILDNEYFLRDLRLNLQLASLNDLALLIHRAVLIAIFSLLMSLIVGWNIRFPTILFWLSTGSMCIIVGIWFFIMVRVF